MKRNKNKTQTHQVRHWEAPNFYT